MPTTAAGPARPGGQWRTPDLKGGAPGNRGETAPMHLTLILVVALAGGGFLAGQELSLQTASEIFTASGLPFAAMVVAHMARDFRLGTGCLPVLFAAAALTGYSVTSGGLAAAPLVPHAVAAIPAIAGLVCAILLVLDARARGRRRAPASRTA